MSWPPTDPDLCPFTNYEWSDADLLQSLREKWYLTRRHGFLWYGPGKRNEPASEFVERKAKAGSEFHKRALLFVIKQRLIEGRP